ncbi:SET domain-containing protein [Fulvia fulva]|uniref:SET domain-containing protein n=1 Tax=Passalora fulva TaxID=5499 RepID=A0A9Q8P3B3_PASFU|nr:SET domain-containing protein [Fulvia fulva]KAK4638537.1 SET domain-containing protein [Fulvia fulva]UJO11758.1 SET domain-containing protein [Fulvia fulva]WPV08340.1 SET domain-containing protein [Fulvia fulva]
MTMPDLDSDVEALARDIGLRINEELPRILRQLLNERPGVDGGQFHFECSLSSGHAAFGDRPQAVRLASVDIPADVGTPITYHSPRENSDSIQQISARQSYTPTGCSAPGSPDRPSRPRLPAPSTPDDDPRPAKRRAVGGLRIGRNSPPLGSNAMTRSLESDARVFPQRKKRLSENPALQPSSLDKFIGGIWESIFSGVRMDPAEVIEQWQAIEANGQPRLLMDSDTAIASSDDSSIVRGTMFGRMNILARKISQTSRTCRSLEVIVQAHWVQAFDDRVSELSSSMTKEKAKKTAISEACMDFSWSEKELRNKMAIWRGYHDIQNTGGWAALVFAGMGLYRFCKYRVSFTEETFQTLRSLRHRFEVAADTLHPRWRSLLAIVGATTERKYTGHQHDWVVNSPNNEAVPLATTYHRWDKNFSYIHLDESAIDEDAWGLFDPRTVVPATDPASQTCQTCGEQQSDDPRTNHCSCFPNLYGSAKAGFIPVQVYRTPNGKNNGLLACSAFERGAAVGEFIGEITAGLTNMDVMVGQTERAAYQIWQGKQGNHTRFVNHSCQPNSQFERFVWLGTQRVVLVSKGIEAGEEVTVDYSDTYWKNLDKACLCGHPKCRFKGRSRPLLTPPEST